MRGGEKVSEVVYSKCRLAQQEINLLNVYDITGYLINDTVLRVLPHLIGSLKGFDLFYLKYIPG